MPGKNLYIATADVGGRLGGSRGFLVVSWERLTHSSGSLAPDGPLPQIWIRLLVELELGWSYIFFESV